VSRLLPSVRARPAEPGSAPLDPQGSIDRTTEPVRLHLAIPDAELAERIGAALADLAGVRLVGAEESPDAVLVLPPAAEPAGPEEGFTPREIEVLNLLAEGASNKAIARRLGISVHTVKFHVGSLIDKLDAVGRTDAVAQAARLGVLHL
jgi:DNA-binding CsgD family transcriptional regulator